jgi:hypothetical protein
VKKRQRRRNGLLTFEAINRFAGQIAAGIASAYAAESLTPRVARKDGPSMAEAAYALAEALLVERKRLLSQK